MSKLAKLTSIIGGLLIVGAATTTAIVGAAAPRAKRSPADLVGALHAAFGQHHARAVHTKGIVLEGAFEPDAGAAKLTRAAHLQATRSKVTLRFSNFTGLPEIPDNAGPANPRGIALRFTLPGGVFSDIVGHSFDGFPTSTSDEFRDLLLAISKSGPDAAKPTAVDQFLDRHPVAKTFLTTQKSPASFATITYFGVNAFELTNKEGASRFARYQIVPVGGEKLMSSDEMSKQGAMYLFDEIKARVAKSPFRFELYAQLAERGDKIDDPSIAWPSTRTRVLLGTITIDKLGANTSEADKSLALSPTNLVDGIKPADPMIEFRGRAYPISVKERQ